jgi:hypothetical protein
MTVLRDIAQANDVTLTEAVRRAIGLLKLVNDARDAGEEIQVVDLKTNKVRVVHLI